MSSSYSLPPILVSQIEALVDSGHFSSRSDVVKEALRFMIEKKNYLRHASAVEMYKKGKATLTKGAETAAISAPFVKVAFPFLYISTAEACLR